MSCVEFGRRLLRAVIAHVTQLPYREFEQQVRWRLLTWLCREMMKLLGGTHERDGFPTDEPIDTLAVFEVMKEGIDYKWSHFVVYMDWLITTLGPERAYHTWQTLKKHHPQDIPTILELTTRWLVTIGCCRSVCSSSRIDAEGSLMRIARGIGLHTASPRSTTVRDAPGLGVSQGRAMASRFGGGATSETMEWWASLSLDGHRCVVQIRLGGPREEQDRHCGDSSF